MKIDYKSYKERRKELAIIIAEDTGTSAKYTGVPKCAYQIGALTLDRNGVLEFPEGTAKEKGVEIFEKLKKDGYTGIMIYEAGDVQEKVSASECQNEPVSEENDTDGKVIEDGVENATEAKFESDEDSNIIITIPAHFYGTHTLDNLDALIEGKGNLMRRALQAETLDYILDRGNDKISFPWFHSENLEDAKYYGDFIIKLLAFAKKARRVTVKAKEHENEKYAFRCFLLRLGFIGPEHKMTRKILMQYLEGSSAFKTVKEDDGD